MVPQAEQKFSQSSFIWFRGVGGATGDSMVGLFVRLGAPSRHFTCFELVGFMVVAANREEIRGPMLDDLGGEDGDWNSDGDGDGDGDGDANRDADDEVLGTA